MARWKSSPWNWLWGFAAALLVLAAAQPAEAQRAIFVVRHAEKAREANEPDVPLSEAGQARARRLAAILGRAGVSAIYSTDMVRTLATAEPLARVLKIPIRKYAAKGPDGKPDPALLLKTLKSEHARDVVLVVGHADTVPPLLAALGCADKIEIPAGEYDDLFVVVPAGPGRATLLRLVY
jgi:phosphohistidine phosphatase SixA